MNAFDISLLTMKLPIAFGTVYQRSFINVVDLFVDYYMRSNLSNSKNKTELVFRSRNLVKARNYRIILLDSVLQGKICFCVNFVLYTVSQRDLRVKAAAASLFLARAGSAS
jgi:hypothetical protein